MRPFLPFRNARSHFEDIVESIDLVFVFVGEIDFVAYELDLKTKSAVERQLQILTEAAYRLGDEADVLCPGPNWKGWMGMGNVLRHAYHRVDDRVVWDTVKLELPLLREQVSTVLAKMPDGGDSIQDPR